MHRFATKTVAWPPDYARGHANDHFLVDEIRRELSGLTFSEHCSLQLPWLIKGTKNDLRDFAKEVAAQIKSGYRSLEPGFAIGSRRDSGRAWWFYITPEEDRDEDEPEKGLRYTWIYHGDSETLLACESAPAELHKAFEDIFLSCGRKFASYGDCRRILLLHPYGDLAYMPENWWREKLLTNPPSAVDEIWTGGFYGEKGWEFERLHPFA